MSPTVYIAMFGWIPVVVALFASLPPRRAAISAFIFAWLFLPTVAFQVQGLPDYTKVSATCLGVLLGTVMFDSRSLLTIRPSWADAPIVVWTLSPIVTSYLNGLGIYDGLSVAFETGVMWGLPYLIGRVYLGDLAGLRALAVGIFVGGLVYAPLCLLEVRLSPQLNRWIYGYHVAGFMQTKRLGGWRPTVFMQHGLMVGMWMTAATLCGVWLWRGRMKTLGQFPMFVLVPFLVGSTILCKSLGAFGLLFGGLCALFSSTILKTRWVMVALASIPLVYIGVRTTGAYDIHRLVPLAAMIDENRAESLEARFSNEDLLIEKALQRRFFGWGGYNRSRIEREEAGDSVPIDGMWIIALGQRGMVGALSITLLAVVPGLLILRRRPSAWAHPLFAGPAALATLLLISAVDNLLNAMINPVFMLAAGGLVGAFATRKGRLSLPTVSRAGVAHSAPARFMPGMPPAWGAQPAPAPARSTERRA